LHTLHGFIDAVISWENLFGAAGETSLRVCGSLARLLHPNDSPTRTAFFKRTKKIYDKRSRLVHGGEQRLTHAEAAKLRDESVDIAMDAWRAVLESEMLREAKDSAARGILVLVEGPF
jgi:hypothetical protein